MHQTVPVTNHRRPKLDDYTRARDQYRPGNVKVLWIAESPPTAYQSYFYFPKTTGRDHLFRETMRSVGLWPFKKKMVKNLEKHALLKSFQANGFFLIDTCNYPVDKLSKHERRVAVLDGASRIMNLVRELNPRKIIIVKSNVYGPVKRALYKADYHKRILNKTALAFPSHGNQKAYRTRIGRMIADGRVVLKLAA